MSSASMAPGLSGNRFRPTPPQRGSFPLDHDGECTELMKSYMECLKLVDNSNAPACREVAKKYLKCRMDNGLMEKESWKNLGLPEDARDSPSATGNDKRL